MALVNRLGVVTELERVNQDLWESLGKIDAVEDVDNYDSNRAGIKRAISVDLRLIHESKNYSRAEESIFGEVYGPWSTADNSNSPYSYSVDYRSGNGWHTEVVGKKILDPRVSVIHTSQIVKVHPNADFSNFEMTVIDSALVGFRGFSQIFSQEGLSLKDPGIDAIVDADHAGMGIFIRAKSTDNGILQAHRYLALSLAWINGERARIHQMPQDYKRREEESLAESSKGVGETIYREGFGPTKLRGKRWGLF